jgi:hypothetical protein
MAQGPDGKGSDCKSVAPQGNVFESRLRLQILRYYIMIDKAFELTMKSISGEELTDDEKKYMRERNAKYELVRYVYMEKMKHEGSSVTQFHFTPGDNFMETPIFDIVSGLLKVVQGIKDGNIESCDFRDLKLKKTELS